jgi:hypothetical protein
MELLCEIKKIMRNEQQDEMLPLCYIDEQD